MIALNIPGCVKIRMSNAFKKVEILDKGELYRPVSILSDMSKVFQRNFY